MQREMEMEREEGTVPDVYKAIQMVLEGCRDNPPPITDSNVSGGAGTWGAAGEAGLHLEHTGPVVVK